MAPFAESSSGQDDDLQFAEETEPDRGGSSPEDRWKLLIVDDEEAVHTMTKMVLSDYSFEGKGLIFLSAHSGEEARQLLRANKDAACILLDVVMETENSGLEVIHFIRDMEKNTDIRIILRTGQPGKAPEKKVILDYDINDYKEKTELTDQKLFTSITTALRSYMHLKKLQEQQEDITRKNRRLNEEVARRIVAESNLAKYNRSLEGMLEDKKNRLRKALDALKQSRQMLTRTEADTTIHGFSSKAALALDEPALAVGENLKTIEQYRHDLTRLLGQYEHLLRIINGHANLLAAETTRPAFEDVTAFRDQIGMDSILEHYPEIIRDSMNGIQHITETISDIRLFISINTSRPVDTDLNHLLRDILKSMECKDKPLIDIQTDFGLVPPVKINVQGMRKVFEAIINNACRAMGNAGIISVSTITDDGNGVIVTISDTGCGIPANDIDRLFKPFYRSGNTGDTPGMGLFFSRTMVNLHRGSIDVESTFGEGTTITIRLPGTGGSCLGAPAPEA